MKRKEARAFDDLDIKISLGNVVINVLYLRFMPTDSLHYIGNHCHSSYELHFIPYGRGILRVQQNIFQIVPGTFYMTGPGVYHVQKSDRIDPMAEYCINFELKKSGRKREKIKDGLGCEMSEIIGAFFATNFWFGRDEYKCIELFDKIMEELENRWLGYYFNIRNLISLIIVNAARCYVKQKKSLYPPPRKIPDDRRRFIIDTFFEEYNKSLSPDDLAKRIGVSTRQLNRIMRRYFSMTFKEKLLRTRLENAKDLLLNTDLSVKSIAEKVGFHCESYFCRVFKRYEAVTPTEYRKKVKL